MSRVEFPRMLAWIRKGTVDVIVNVECRDRLGNTLVFAASGNPSVAIATGGDAAAHNLAAWLASLGVPEVIPAGTVDVILSIDTTETGSIRWNSGGANAATLPTSTAPDILSPGDTLKYGETEVTKGTQSSTLVTDFTLLLDRTPLVETVANLAWKRRTTDTALVNIEAMDGNSKTLLFAASVLPAVQSSAADATARSLAQWLAALGTPETLPTGTVKVAIAVDLASAGGIIYNGGGAASNTMPTAYSPRILNPGQGIIWGGPQ